MQWKKLLGNILCSLVITLVGCASLMTVFELDFITSYWIMLPIYIIFGPYFKVEGYIYYEGRPHEKERLYIVWEIFGIKKQVC